MQDLVEEQKELRVALPEQLQALRDSRTAGARADRDFENGRERGERAEGTRLQTVSQLAGPVF